ncbi:PRD domain-containing protein [Clostridium sp. MSJ-8]|nr:PRD domain-containing protein [Clostridium sp. MSJ-8]
MKKVINNNIVSSIDSNGNEVILRGLGIGFQKKTKDLIEEDKIEKIYANLNKNMLGMFQSLLQEIPPEYEEVCSDIIDNIKNKLDVKVNDNIYISLINHISFAIKRKHEKLEYKNALLWEIKKFYPREYELGVEAVSIIKDRLNEEFSLDEAGFIALHIVNAELGSKIDDTVTITEILHKILQIVKYYYGIEFDEDSLHYERFITHLKFFCNRVMSDAEYVVDDAELNQVIRDKYKKDYKCAEKIRQFIKTEYNKDITEEEMTYLTIHFKRISQGR